MDEEQSRTSKLGPCLEIHLFGRPEFRRADGILPPLSTHKTLSLLAFLILQRNRPHTRDELATLFWGDREEVRARRSLATALWRIRRLLQDDHDLLVESDTVQFNSACSFWLDVVEFEALTASGPPEIDRLTSAVNLYRGDLLEGFFDDWCVADRYRLEELYLRTLSTLIGLHETAGHHEEGLRFAELVLGRDPLREDAHRAAVRLHLRMGNRAEALRQARACRTILQAELGAPPALETVSLFDELLGSHWREENALAPQRPAARTPPVLLLEHPPFVGRETEWRELLAAWELAQSGKGQLLLVSGEAGIGKSRLVQELGGHIKQHGRWVAEGHCFEYERGMPHGPLADLLRSALAIAGPRILSCLSSWQTAELARLAPELEEHLAAPHRQTLLAESEQMRLFNALCSLLLDLSRQTPLLLVLEDLHWAHESTLTWLHYLARHLSESALLVVATYKREEIGPDHPLTHLLPELQQKGLATSLELGRLPPVALARWMEGASAALTNHVYHQTEGNPYFVLETLRALYEEGQVRWEGGRWVEEAVPADAPLPDSIRQVIQSRLDRLAPQAARAVETAAVVGRTFDLDVLERAWGRGEESTLQALDELLRRRLVCEASGPFGKDYEFDHHLVREIVYQRLPPRRRQQLHQRVAEALAGLRGGDPATNAEVAYHYIRAENWEKAQEYLLGAGDQAGSMAADEEALAFYQQALQACERAFGERWEPRQRAGLERKLGEVFFRRGEYKRALDYLQQALLHLGRPFPASAWGIRRAILRAVGQQLGYRLLPTFRSRRSEGPVSPAVEQELDIYTSMGWIDALVANHEHYLLVSLRALNISDRSGFARGTAVAATALGIGADMVPLFGLAAYYHRRAAAVAQGLQDPGALGFVYQGLAYHEYLLGQEDAAFEHAQLSAEAYQQANDAHRWAMSTLIVAYVLLLRGEFASAFELARDLARVGQEGADLQVQCFGEELYGVTLRRQGRVEEASVHLQQAVALAEQIPDHMSRVGNGSELAECYLHRGEWEQAIAVLESSRRIAVEHDVKGDSFAHLLGTLAKGFLTAAEQADPSAQADWLRKAGLACKAALKQAKAFRPGMPEALRLKGTYEWLSGKPAAARRWWEQSLSLAEELGHRHDLGLTLLEMGRLAGDRASLQRAETVLSGIGAELGRPRARELQNT